MIILIVDDSIIKINKIKTVINETNIDTKFLIALNKAEAMDLILSNPIIDLMILDLNLPNRKGEEPKRLAGLSLLKELNRRNSIRKPQHIIGLTAYVELHNETLSEFIENGWIIITYDNTKSEWEDTIKKKVEYINCNNLHQNTPYQNANEFALIMKGGGIKGLAYVGAIEVLQKHFKFTWFAGTSAGAISAILLASGYNYEELKTILYEKNFNDFKDSSFLKGILNLVLKGGYYEARTFDSWIDHLIAKKIGQATEVKMKSLPLRASIYASTQTKKALIFDTNDIKTNDIGAGFATRCSISIPFIFVPQKNYGYNVFDGGIQNNYPVNILLEENPKTKFLGLYLGPEVYEGKKKSSIFGEIIKIWSESIDYVALEKYGKQTIIIDTRPISTLKFKLSKEEKDFLVDCGKVYALKYLVKNKFINCVDIGLDEKIKNLETSRSQLHKRNKFKKKIRLMIVLIIVLSLFITSKLFF